MRKVADPASAEHVRSECLSRYVWPQSACEMCAGKTGRSPFRIRQPDP